MTKENQIDVKLDKNCPLCDSPMLRLWGYGWDWDLGVCSNKECMYEEELNESTGIDSNGLFVMKKPEEEE